MDKVEVKEDQVIPTGSIKSRYNLGYAERNPFLERAREAAEITIPSLLPREGHSSANFFKQPFQAEHAALGRGRPLSGQRLSSDRAGGAPAGAVAPNAAARASTWLGMLGSAVVMGIVGQQWGELGKGKLVFLDKDGKTTKAPKDKPAGKK